MSARAWQWRRSKPPRGELTLTFYPEALPPSFRVYRRVELARRRRLRRLAVRRVFAGNPEEAGEK